MPDPLPSDVVARLRSDSTAALAASLILAGSFPDIVSWALRAFSVKDSEPKNSIPTDVDRKGANIKHRPRRPAAKSDQALPGSRLPTSSGSVDGTRPTFQTEEPSVAFTATHESVMRCPAEAKQWPIRARRGVDFSLARPCPGVR